MLAVFLLIILVIIWKTGMMLRYVLITPLWMIWLLGTFKVPSNWGMIIISPVVFYLAWKWSTVWKYQHTTLFSHKISKSTAQKVKTENASAKEIEVFIIATLASLVLAVIHSIVADVSYNTSDLVVLVFFISVVLISIPLQKLINNHILKMYKDTKKWSKWVKMASVQTKLKVNYHDKHTDKYEKMLSKRELAKKK